MGLFHKTVFLLWNKLQLPYRIPSKALVKPSAKDRGYIPDLLLLNRQALASEPLWLKSATITQGTSIPLLVEVVSTNGRDDYLKKFADYEMMGILEYWIADYAAFDPYLILATPENPPSRFASLWTQSIGWHSSEGAIALFHLHFQISS